jgi:RimJ/RimL family protein N-acetyltransferase
MMALFIDYLFTYFSFRKIYLDVYEYNNASVDPVKNFSFQLEGVFGEHRYFDGKWHTMNRYALYRTEIDRVRQFLARG